jgi:hypothetical protein
VRTGQTRHLELATAEKVDAAMVSAVRRTIAYAQFGSVASASGSCICSRASLVGPSWTRAAPPLSSPNSSNAPASTAAW